MRALPRELRQVRHVGLGGGRKRVEDAVESSQGRDTPVGFGSHAHTGGYRQARAGQHAEVCGLAADDRQRPGIDCGKVEDERAVGLGRRLHGSVE